MILWCWPDEKLVKVRLCIFFGEIKDCHLATSTRASLAKTFMNDDFISGALVLAKLEVNETCELGEVLKYGSVLFHSSQVVETEHNNKSQVLAGRRCTQTKLNLLSK